MKKRSTYSAFSLIELGITILIIGILIVGITNSEILTKSARFKSAKTLTQGSAVMTTDDLILWYETALETSFIASEMIDGGTISTWYDNDPAASPNKNNATQSTTDSKPKFYENVFNGSIPGIRFDGTDDYMNFDGTELLNTDYTIFIVEQRRATVSSVMYMIGGTGNSTNTNLSFGYSSDTAIKLAHYSNDLTYTNSTIFTYSTPTPRIHTGIFSSSTGKSYYLNGVSKVAANGQLVAITSFAGSALGKRVTAYYNGDIAEIIVFDRALASDERQEIEIYLSNKYGIKLI